MNDAEADKKAKEILMLGAITAALLDDGCVSVGLPMDEQGQVSNYMWVSVDFMRSRYRLTVTMDPEDEVKNVLSKETLIALKNYDWLLQNRSDVEIDWASHCVIYGDGGVGIAVLCEPGFTPATGDLND